MRSIYFDYNATTPLDSQVREAMLIALDEFQANPSSVHRLGQKARAILDAAHERVACVWGCKTSQVIFTSGGTESNNLAVFGTTRKLRNKGRHIITSAIEHPSILAPCKYLAQKEGYELSILPVNSEGLLDPAHLEKEIRPDTVLVSIIAANNEIGVIQPFEQLGSICKSRGVVFHTDAVQYFGKAPFTSVNQFHADLVSVCSHKYHGPKGCGALFLNNSYLLEPLQFGGGQENERRAGTENLCAIEGFTKATELFIKTPVFSDAHLIPLRDALQESLSVMAGVRIHSRHLNRLNNTVALSVEECDSLSLLAGLDLEGICASSGSACSTGSIQPSLVLKAIGVPASQAQSLIRFSLGRENTMEDIQELIHAFEKVLGQVRGLKT